ncbi:hypothetical protein C0992_004010 [Termitomyces sp. T32_za158]|nr:hypothetical protein C0992_004010 [Termitomyces sp. T32_za158]
MALVGEIVMVWGRGPAEAGCGTEQGTLVGTPQGVWTAIYAQNLLSFIPTLWALKDRQITLTKLEELEKQSATILITAFAILISTVIQAHNHGISDYHAAIILDLSWMNNTNLFIYFLLYTYHRVNLLEDELINELGESASHASLSKGLSKWIYEANKAARKFVIIIGSLHLALMAAVGIWLWSHPAGFGGSGLCSLSATISIFGKQVQLGSDELRMWSIMVYSTALIPMLNLFIPIAFFSTLLLILKHIFRSSGKLILHTTLTGLGTLAIIDVVMLVDTEVAMKRNRKQFQLSSETQWTYGQTLAILLLLVALHDLGESILEKRARQLDKQLLEASKSGEKKSVQSLLRQGARGRVLGMTVTIFLLE